MTKLQYLRKQQLTHQPKNIKMYTKPKIFTTFPKLLAIETTRQGGFSAKPYASLNLGLNSGEELENINKNRLLLFNELQIRPSRVASANQIHSDGIRRVTRCRLYDGYDALITNNVNTYLTITMADCTPILIYDPVNQAVAAIHAGWKGTVKDIAAKTLQRMQVEFKTNPTNCFAYVGTCIDGKNFEVGPEVAQQFALEFKTLDSTKKKFFVDLKKANTAQLIKCGIPEKQIEVSPFSTVEDNKDYFSFRKEKGKTGRMVVLIGLRKETV
jgi:YfiH family protein